MKLRKTMAIVAASAIAVSAMATTAFAATLEAGQAILAFGDADWKNGTWGKAGNTDDVLSNDYFTLANVTADGTYTVAVDLSKGYVPVSGGVAWVDEETGDELTMTTGNGIGAMGINLNLDPEDETYADVTCTIKSVKFDGVEYALTGTSYTNAEDGMKRTNVYNAWANFKAETDKCTDAATATATVIDIASLTEWSKCEVTFEVTGMPAVEDAAIGDGATVGDTDAAGTADKGNADTGVEGVAAIAGLAIVAAGAIVVAKKRK